MDQIPLSATLDGSRSAALPVFNTAKPARFSRDEMNLAEFPLTVLSTRTDPSLKTLEFKDAIRSKNGEMVERRWIITGADKFGLPTASDDEVLLGLLKLTVDCGFTQRKVFFTRYELLRILRWSTEGRSYVRLQRALDRLSGVRIKASNAFYDNESKSHSTRNFGIIDAYEINDGRSAAADCRVAEEGQGSPRGGTKPSFFEWSEVIFRSFQAGFIKKLDLEFYLSLQSAVSKRLYRFLDKHFWYKARVRANVFCLAHEKIGISRNYRYVSSLRQQLDPAFEELQAKGFIQGFDYVGKGTATEVEITAARSGVEALPAAGRTVLKEEQRQPAAPLVTEVDEEKESEERRTLVEMLCERGLQQSQSKRVIAGVQTALLPRVRSIIHYFDQLVAAKSPKVSRSPIGFLYRAVERCDKFTLPNEQEPLCAHAERGAHAEKGANVYRADHEQRTKQPEHRRDFLDLEAQYLVERRHEILKVKSKAEPELLKRIRREVEHGLVRLRDHISTQRFAETVEHGVEEKLAELFAVPSFTEWSREKSRHTRGSKERFKKFALK